MTLLVNLLFLPLASCTLNANLAVEMNEPAVTAGHSIFSYFTQSFYHMFIPPLLVLSLSLAWLARPSTSENIPGDFRHFQVSFLVAWCLCVGADWLQGPYVYALYASYGYSSHQIAQLFVAGFGSSMIFGCFVGSFADMFGRKKTCVAYCVFYIISCLTKHFNIYSILMFGRITGGIATSMLFSGFECWMVSEHTVRHHFSGGLLSYMFGLMFTSMYLVAIATGFAAQLVVESMTFKPIAEGSNIYVGGSLGPFDMSIVCLVIGMIWITTQWAENYGQGSGESVVRSGRSRGGITETLSEAGKVLISDPRIFMMGVVLSCFEGAMYAFVFNWTPALASEKVPPPHGLIFSAFMMTCMCGASATSIVSNTVRPTIRMAFICLLGVFAFNVSAWMSGKQDHLMLVFVCFLAFEFCVGVYFPSAGLMKSEVVPEHVRTTIYNIYRVPLNAVVVGLLLTDISMVRCFHLCAALLTLSCLGIGFVAYTKKVVLTDPISSVEVERKGEV